MNNNQRVLVFSLAMTLCLVVATVTADEADEAKAAALLAEMLYPEYANSPEFQAFGKAFSTSCKACLRELDLDLRKRSPPSNPSGSVLDSLGRQRPAVQKRTPSTLKCTSSSCPTRKDSNVEFETELFNSDSDTEKRGSCTGIPQLDIFGCGKEKRVPSAIPGLDLLGRVRTGKRGAPSCTGIPGLDILGCGEAKRSPSAIPGLDLLGRVRNGKRGAPSCTGIPGLDILGCGEVKRAPDTFDLLESLRETREKRGRPTCIPHLDILGGCGEAKRSSEISKFGVLENRQESAQKRGAPSCTGIPGLDILGCGEAKRGSKLSSFEILEHLQKSAAKRGAPSCTGIPGLDILGCGEEEEK